ncbi:MAG: hypothetical protein JXA11_07645 [Phycisphaerae bacterium]|nr:hypothetical protein [Phycisphaerae bacterium]
MRTRILGVLILLVLLVPATWWFVRANRTKQYLRNNAPRLQDAETPPAQRERIHAATGFSMDPEVPQAVRQAVAMAREGLNGKKENFAFVVCTPEYDVETVRDEVSRILAPGAKVHGMISAGEVMTEKGFHKSPHGAVALLLVREDSEIHFGVGAADQNEVKDMETLGETAMRRALASSKMPKTRRPDFVLYAGVLCKGGETRILDGIANVVGTDTPVLGGNIGYPTSDAPFGPFTRDHIHPNGVVLTAIYTDRTFGWAFEYGFRPTDTTGIVTKASPGGDILYEIDGRPALDVYNEWLDGKLLPVVENESVPAVVGFTACNPIWRRIDKRRSLRGHVVAAVIPTRKNLADRSLPVFVSIPKGNRIRLLAGRWQSLLNRAEQAAVMALLRGGNRPENVEFGIFHFCWAASCAIPPSELPKLPLLVRNQLPHAPFIGLFTKGEQGPIPGFRNVHGNLAASMLLVEQEPPKPEKEKSSSP